MLIILESVPRWRNSNWRGSRIKKPADWILYTNRVKILVTGAAGFIGSTLSQRLLDRGDEVVGFDNFNSYYDPQLKRDRAARLTGRPGFQMVDGNLEDRGAVEDLFATHRPERVVNLAAQAGVRYSLQNPHAYIDANVVGFMNILEGCRHHDVQHLAYASSSSVYLSLIHI